MREVLRSIAQSINRVLPSIFPAAREYDSFGNLITNSSTGTWPGRFGYQGQAWLEIGSGNASQRLLLSPTRIYDPATGRFLQNEPMLVIRPREHYIYARQNPMRHVDPKGLYWKLCGFANPEAAAVVLNDLERYFGLKATVDSSGRVSFNGPHPIYKKRFASDKDLEWLSKEQGCNSDKDKPACIQGLWTFLSGSGPSGDDWHRGRFADAMNEYSGLENPWLAGLKSSGKAGAGYVAASLLGPLGGLAIAGIAAYYGENDFAVGAGVTSLAGLAVIAPPVVTAAWDAFLGSSTASAAVTVTAGAAGVSYVNGVQSNATGTYSYVVNVSTGQVAVGQGIHVAVAESAGMMPQAGNLVGGFVQMVGGKMVSWDFSSGTFPGTAQMIAAAKAAMQAAASR